MALAHPDLAAEQAYMDRAYAALDAMKALAVERLQAALTQGKGTMQALMERDVVVENSLGRLEQLQIGDEPLSFGRIDVRENPERDAERWYIGRLAVSGPEQEPLVVDWRAPIAEPFYRATGRHPMGLSRRRHFLTHGRRVAGIEDEVFGSGGGDADGDELEVSGSGALLAALERSRTGQMRDIVATVQREQDEIIRGDLPGALVVQGGPGTGKTAVALHRAAYLLYTHRFPLERQGVLVVGPNPLFLRYIEHVLPSLGETGVFLSSVNGLVQQAKVSGQDATDVARLKGDPRMAQLVKRAMRTRQRALRKDLVVPFGAATLRIPARVTDEIVSAVRRRSGSHNARRRHIEVLLTRRLVEANDAAIERARRTGLRGRTDDAEMDVEIDRDDLGAQLRRTAEVRVALDRMWPVLTPVELIHDLFGSLPLIDAAGQGLLSPEECRLLHRPRSSSADQIPWTSADLPLLDEAQVHLGTRRRGEDDSVRTYGHIVVDEAQDLTPMQLRVLGRRSMSGSMTIVGDIAQATGPWAPRSWQDVMAHLPGSRNDRQVELTVNYRTPSEIMALAGRVLAVAAPDIPLPRSVRSSESPPVFAELTVENLVAGVAERVARLAQGPAAGTVAVIHPPSLGKALAGALTEAGVRYGDPDQDGLDEIVTLVPMSIVKGLEFDSVVVVEPARIVSESPQGMRALFVALTRSTQRLIVAHAEPLPEPLR